MKTARTLWFLAAISAAAALATTAHAQGMKPTGGGGAKTLEQVTNPKGNVPVEQAMNPAGVQDVEALMKPSAVKSPDELANPSAVKSLDEVTRDATQDVGDLTEPSGDE